MAVIEHEKRQIAKEKAEELAAAMEISSNINKKTFTVDAKAGESGKLFGAVTSKELSDAIYNELNIRIDKKKIVLPEPLKATGEYEIAIKIHPEVETSVTVAVRPV
jgi:large subunit ribosomal protein L9